MTAPRTPGPWHYLDIGEVVSSDPVTGLPDPGDMICAVAGEDPVADGSLIAAAPSLFNAATLALDYILHRVGNDAAETVTVADLRAALAKARGES